ncbi:MAG TPA: hypothetical protein VF843_15175, partial [Streptosporangiaceae bacterium]
MSAQADSLHCRLAVRAGDPVGSSGQRGELGPQPPQCRGRPSCAWTGTYSLVRPALVSSWPAASGGSKLSEPWQNQGRR